MTARRTPIARSTTPIPRRARVKRRRSTPRRRVEASPTDTAYQAFVRGLPCILALHGGCQGDVEAHHAGVKPGRGMKAPASSCIPLCHKHHIGELHGLMGFFKGWTRDRLRAWQDAWIEATQAAHARWLCNTAGDDLPF